MKLLISILITVCLGTGATSARAEQKMTFGEYDVHYIVLPTTFLNTKIANKYDLPRGKDRALVNISVLDAQGVPVKVQVTGSTQNLLGQRQQLSFAEVTEGSAVYYLALLRHADEEFHQLALDVKLPDGKVAELRFQQQMFWDR
jgi:glycogen debranching enzyme